MSSSTNTFAARISLSGMLEPMVQIDGIAKRFGAFDALRNVSFSIHRHEILGLIGPNGSGKTTLFRCLAGLMPASGGRVSVSGAPVSPRERKNHLYFVPDGVRPWPDQTVEWVLRYTAGIHGSADAANADAIFDVARRLSLDPLLDERLHGLSKGEMRRVLTAVGLLTTPELLLLDEPFDGLDLRQTREMMDLLRATAAEGRTLFLSIHQLTDAARICDRFVLLSGGRVAGEGTLDQLRERAHLPTASLEDVFLALT